MRPTAIVCGTAMLICYAVFGTVWDPSWYALPLLLMGVVVAAAGFGEGRVQE